MKKIFTPVPFLLLILALIVCSCKSKKEKALELIDKEMFNTLCDYKSYEPIEITIDSAFTSIYRDSTIRNLCDMSDLISYLFDQCISKTKDASRTMDIYRDLLYSSYGYSQFKEAYEEYSKQHTQAKVYLKAWQANCDTISQLAAKMKDDFCGWKATHKFRCKSKGGNSLLATYVYVFDPKIKNILYYYDTEDKQEQSIMQMVDNAMKPRKDSITLSDNN